MTLPDRDELVEAYLALASKARAKQLEEILPPLAGLATRDSSLADAERSSVSVAGSEFRDEPPDDLPPPVVGGAGGQDARETFIASHDTPIVNPRETSSWVGTILRPGDPDGPSRRSFCLGLLFGVLLVLALGFLA